MAEADPEIATDAPASDETPAPAPKKRRWRRIALMALVPLLLIAGAIALRPAFEPIYGIQPETLSGDAFQESRAYMIAPLAYGGDTGRRMAATDAVVPLASSPERPQIDMSATLGRGDSFERVLKRAGVGGDGGLGSSRGYHGSAKPRGRVDKALAAHGQAAQTVHG